MNDLDDEMVSWYKKVDDIYEVDFNGSINHFYPEYILSYGPASEPNKILFATTLEFLNIYYYLKILYLSLKQLLMII